MCSEYWRLLFRWLMNHDPRAENMKRAELEKHVEMCAVCKAKTDEVPNVQN